MHGRAAANVDDDDDEDDDELEIDKWVYGSSWAPRSWPDSTRETMAYVHEPSRTATVRTGAKETFDGRERVCERDLNGAQSH